MNGTKNLIKFLNPVKSQVFDKYGILKSTHEALNGVVDTGIHYLLETGFDGLTQEGNWYIGLMNASPTLDPSDTILAAGHSGWTEFTAYSETPRPEWEPAAPSSRAIVNSSTVDFSITGGASTVSGIFVSTESAISGPGTGEILWATAEFASAASVTGGDTLKVTYTVSG